MVRLLPETGCLDRVEFGHPKLVGSAGGEAALDKVGGTVVRHVGDRGEPAPPAQPPSAA